MPCLNWLLVVVLKEGNSGTRSHGVFDFLPEVVPRFWQENSLYSSPFEHSISRVVVVGRVQPCVNKRSLNYMF